MKIVSAFPYVWPHLGFALAVGENEIDENKIPLSAHAKLLHLSKPGIDATGTPIPAPISGYKPSTALADAADKHFPRKSSVKPPAATLESLTQSQPAQSAPEPAKDPEQAKRGEQRR
ncbi:MAG TPA: hypothetical protein VER11_34565 [Polyangiaceae bacterium]|nr:hypothetical protein [Polyangiaceae bacterium]